MTAYRPDCLKCGAALIPVVTGPHSAPWKCPECPHNYYVCELIEESRVHYRESHHDFSGHDRVMRILISEESQAAHARKTSLRQDQVGLISKTVLRALLKRGVAAGMEHHIRQALKG